MTTLSPTLHNPLTLGWNECSVLATVWHPWTVIIPRRTITGRLVRGLVWRRHNGRHWQYKKFVANAEQNTCRA